MPFDWEKLKQRFNIRKSAQKTVPQEPVASAPQAPEAPIVPAPQTSPAEQEPQAVVEKPKTPFALFMEGMKKGMKDVKAVLAEGKYSLFVKQFIVVVLAFMGVYFLIGKLKAQKEEIVDKVSALVIQQTNEKDYLDNKERLLRLEPLFPDLAKKNEWLLQTLMKTFEDHKIQVNIDGNAAENVAADYTTVGQLVTFQQEFMPLGKFLADVENGDSFLRVSEITISKMSDPIGENTVSIRFNTLFPKEKYAKRLFKDYSTQISKIEAEKKPALKKAANQSEQPAPSADQPATDEQQPTSTMPQQAQPTAQGDAQ